MGNHKKEFSYKYAASLITAVRVEETEAFVSVDTQGGEIVETRWPLDIFFDKKPSVGKWLVDGCLGERFIIDESGLKNLGEEITDEAAD